MRISPINLKYTPALLCHNKNNSCTIQSKSDECSNLYNDAIKAQALANISFSAGKSVPIYRIDSNCECKLYETQSSLSKELGVNVEVVSSVVTGKRNHVSGYVVAKKEDVESKNDDGTIFVNKQKVYDLVQQKLFSHAVYAVDSNGNYTKYKTQSDADKSSEDCIFLKASDFEYMDEDGSIATDRAKISKFLIESPYYTFIYSVDKKGNYKKYKNQTELAKKIGCSPAAVSAVIQGKNKTVGGCYVFSAKDIESVGEDGSISVDSNKLDSILRKKSASSRALYVVDEDGKLTRYSTKKELADSFGINYDSFLSSKKDVTPDGRYIIEASEIEEFDENERLNVNLAKLNTIIGKRNSLSGIYTIDIDGNMTRYKNKNKVAAALARDITSVEHSLKQDYQHRFLAGLLVVKAREIETIDDEGNISVDKHKVAQIMMESFGKKAVYVVSPDGTVKKYKNRHSLVKELGITHSQSQGYKIGDKRIISALALDTINKDGDIVLDTEKLKLYMT